MRWGTPLLASGVEDRPWIDDILGRGRGTQEKAISLERDVLGAVNTRM